MLQQPTSIGNNLSDMFWKNIKKAFKIKSKFTLILHKLIIYSKIQRKSIAKIPNKIKQNIKLLKWKDAENNKMNK